MSNYKIIITKTDANPNYKEEMAEYMSKGNFYDRGSHRDKGEPLQEFVKDALMVELSEEQYKKVKAEVIKVFE